MAYLVSSVIDQSFLDLGVTQPTDVIGVGIQTAAFIELQQMIDSWAAEETMGFVWNEGSFNLSAGVQAYTFGLGGTLNTTPNVPIRLVSASSRLAGTNLRNPCKVTSFQEFHATVGNPTGARSVLAGIVAVDQNFPLMNVLVHPPPDTAPGILDLGYRAQLARLTSVTQDISALYPLEWFEAMHFGLAMALYPGYARVASARPEVLAQNFQTAKGAIAAKNAAILGMTQQAAK